MARPPTSRPSGPGPELEGSTVLVAEAGREAPLETDRDRWYEVGDYQGSSFHPDEITTEEQRQPAGEEDPSSGAASADQPQKLGHRSGPDGGDPVTTHIGIVGGEARIH